MARSSPTIGVDVDGVLGDQVTPLLPLAEARTGVRLSFDEITEWNVAIGNSDFKTEIAAAMEEPRFVDDMPLHEGASEMMQGLRDDGWRILVITTRGPHLLDATTRWLTKHSLPFEEVISAATDEKALHGADVLVDDYSENIKHFLAVGFGRAVLVDRPWNRKRAEFASWLAHGTLRITADLREIPRMLRTEEV